MNIRSTSTTLGLWAATAAVTASASAGVVTVTNSSGDIVHVTDNNAAALADAMSWVSSQAGIYGVSAQSGKYTGNTQVSSNANLTWGNSPGVIDIIGGGMNVQSSAQMLFELAGTDNSAAVTTGLVDYDTVLAEGNVTYQGRLAVELLSGFTPTVGNSFQLIATTFGKTVSWTGILEAPTLAAGLSWQVNVGTGTLTGYTGQALYLTVVPSPGALALLATAGTIGIRRRRA
jgi:hypothetical protein